MTTEVRERFSLVVEEPSADQLTAVLEALSILSDAGRIRFAEKLFLLLRYGGSLDIGDLDWMMDQPKFSIGLSQTVFADSRALVHLRRTLNIEADVGRVELEHCESKPKAAARAKLQLRVLRGKNDISLREQELRDLLAKVHGYTAPPDLHSLEQIRQSAVSDPGCVCLAVPLEKQAEGASTYIIARRKVCSA